MSAIFFVPFCIILVLYYALFRWIFSRPYSSIASKVATIVSAITCFGYIVFNLCYYSMSTSSTASIGIMFGPFCAVLYGLSAFLAAWSLTVITQTLWAICKSSKQSLQPIWAICIALAIIISFGLLIFDVADSRRLYSRMILTLIKTLY